MVGDASGVIRLLDQGGADLLFLDIRMPGLSGVDLARSLPVRPPVIFTTAYPDYAIQGYELDILDYLLKPITEQRFLKAAYKARAYYEKAPVAARPDFLMVKTNDGMERVPHEEILYLEARLNYVLIHTADRRLLTYGSIKSMVKKLPTPAFLRVHKSFVVAIMHVRRVEGNTLTLGDRQLPVSRSAKAALMALFTNGSPPRDPS